MTIKIPAEELDHARKHLDDAEFGLQHDRFRIACRDAYYAAFHAAQARLAKEGRETKNHKSVNYQIGELYRGIDFPFQATLSKLQSLREGIDYGKIAEPSKEQAENAVAQARKIMTRVEQDIGPQQTKALDPSVLEALRNQGLGR